MDPRQMTAICASCCGGFENEGLNLDGKMDFCNRRNSAFDYEILEDLRQMRRHEYSKEVSLIYSLSILVFLFFI